MTKKNTNSKRLIIEIGIIPIIIAPTLYFLTPNHFYANIGFILSIINVAISLIVSIILLYCFKDKLKYVFAIIAILLALLVIFLTWAEQRMCIGCYTKPKHMNCANAICSENCTTDTCECEYVDSNGQLNPVECPNKEAK